MRRSTLFLLAAALPCGPLHAQLETVTPGSRVRVRLTAASEPRIRGELVARIRDTVALQGGVEKRFGRTGPMLPRAFPLSSVQRIDVSVGRSPVTGALRGAALGTAAGLAYGGIVWFFGKINGNGGYFKQQTQVSASTSTKGALIGLVPICALIGGINAPDKWRRVYPTQ